MRSSRADDWRCCREGHGRDGEELHTGEHEVERCRDDAHRKCLGDRERGSDEQPDGIRAPGGPGMTVGIDPSNRKSRAVAPEMLDARLSLHHHRFTLVGELPMKNPKPNRHTSPSSAWAVVVFVSGGAG
jgi:hypothetical protein